jgi:methyltransferase (TIGR00027 family)
VRWFEADHPATQRDKRSRLRRLGIDAGHIRFVAADFTVDPVADLLVSAGLAPGERCLFLLEGVAVYLEVPVLRALLRQLRQVAADGSELAISLSVSTASGEHAARRAAFQAAVAAVGEPACSVLEADGARDLLTEAGWRFPADPQQDQPNPADPQPNPVEPRPDQADRRCRAGFILATPA